VSPIEDSPFEKWRLRNLMGVAASPEIMKLIAQAYEGGFIDGMQKQMASSVDRAVNGMSAPPSCVNLMRGVRVEDETVVISAKGGNEGARQLCAALIEEMKK
jgi:tripartite-type tricarboxylate transporter receptor subunit TctC